MRLLAAMGLAVLIAGCASLDTKMNTWLGAHQDQLYREWGPPTQEAALSNGNRLLVYVNGSNMYVPVGGIVHNVSNSCRIQFEADGSGIIQAWQARGNCR